MHVGGHWCRLVIARAADDAHPELPLCEHERVERKAEAAQQLPHVAKLVCAGQRRGLGSDVCAGGRWRGCHRGQRCRGLAWQLWWRRGLASTTVWARSAAALEGLPVLLDTTEVRHWSQLQLRACGRRVDVMAGTCANRAATTVAVHAAEHVVSQRLQGTITGSAEPRPPAAAAHTDGVRR